MAAWATSTQGGHRAVPADGWARAACGALLSLTEDNCAVLSAAPSVAQRCGGNPKRAYRLTMRVLAMGDHNACDIAQMAHERVLEQAHVVSPDKMLRHGKPLPSHGPLIGAYLDDLLVGAIVKGDGGPPTVREDDEDFIAVKRAEKVVAALRRDV